MVENQTKIRADGRNASFVMNHVCVSVDVQKREFELVSGNVIVFL